MDSMRELTNTELESVAGGQAAAAASAGANSATALAAYNAPSGIMVIGFNGENITAAGSVVAAAAATAN